LMLAIESDAGVGTLSLKDDDEASLARTGLPVHRGGTARWIRSAPRTSSMFRRKAVVTDVPRSGW